MFVVSSYTFVIRVYSVNTDYRWFTKFDGSLCNDIHLPSSSQGAK